MRVRESAQELDYDSLEEHCGAQYCDKDIVVEYAFEHVYLLHFPRVYLVESLQDKQQVLSLEIIMWHNINYLIFVSLTAHKNWPYIHVRDYLAEDEGIEYDSVKDEVWMVSMKVEDCLSSCLKVPNHDKLVNRLSEDVSPHDITDEIAFPSDWSSLH